MSTPSISLICAIASAPALADQAQTATPLAAQTATPAAAPTGQTAAADYVGNLTGEIVVTARRREERLLEVPLAISVFGFEARLRF